jgi:GH25 family lysozyme M1 (1,4-beta-N-acetylmuramidase)
VRRPVRFLRRSVVPLTALAVLLGTVSMARAAVTATGTATGPAALPAATTVPLEGIDVSNWQGTIDWTKVYAAGKRFAIMKATEGTTFTDAYYSVNHASARAAGLWTTAYHFAQPSTTAGDAVAEADHFVSVAKLQSGDLIPALDLEVTGSLSPAALQGWVATWLGEVTAKLGVHPMIYTSPNFWKNAMSDTTWFALNGYRVLWVAHWGVTSPTVPAQNWAGHGWTFWQYSDTGTVPGIAGRVDLDRYNGTDLTPVSYSAFNATLPASIALKQGHVTGATLSLSRVNFPGPITLSLAGLPARVTATFSANPATGGSSSITFTAAGAPTPALIGSYPLTVTATGTGAAGSLTRIVRTTLSVTDGMPPIVTAPASSLYAPGQMGTTSISIYNHWSATDPSGIAGYRLEGQVNDGSWVSVNPPAALTTGITRPMGFGLYYRYRALAIDRNGNWSAWATGRTIRPLLVQQNYSSIGYAGSWWASSSSVASGGSICSSRTAGSSVSYAFWGSSLAWIAARAPDRGSARIWIDGVYAATISLWAPTYQARSIAFARNFVTNGTHSIRISVVGTSGHPRVDVDAFAFTRLS